MLVISNRVKPIIWRVVVQQKCSVLGLTVGKIAIGAGCFMVVWACAVSYLGDSQSMTSWIPAFLGGPILILGYLALARPDRRKLWMHLVAVIAAITFLGGLDFLRPLFTEQNPMSNPLAGLSKLMLLCVGGLLLAACISSFNWTRKNQASGKP